MISVQIQNRGDGDKEWCLLEFQGEVKGSLAGNELGKLEIKDVSLVIIIIQVESHFSLNSTGREKGRNGHWSTFPRGVDRKAQ